MAENVKSIEDERKKRAGDDLPSKDDLEALASKYSIAKADMDEARGEIGAMVKDAEDRKNIHRKAFKDVQKTRGMDATKQAEYLRHRNHYEKVFGVHAQADMFEGSTEPEDEAPAASVN